MCAVASKILGRRDCIDEDGTHPLKVLGKGGIFLCIALHPSPVVLATAEGVAAGEDDVCTQKRFGSYGG